MMNYKLHIQLTIGIMIIAGGLYAQKRDTIKRVEITSAFRPMLKESAKINFNASPAPIDTTKPRLTYDIPTQNLLFAYQPGQLKPLALDIDTGGRWDMSSFIKAGFGSLKTPYIQGAFSFGDGRTAGLNIQAKHISSDGKRIYQDYRNTQFGLRGFFQTSKNMEWNARLGMKQELYYKYGFQPTTLEFPKDSLRQKFQTWSGSIGVHNINLTEFGLSYSPELRIDVFDDGNNNSESNTYLNIPLQKTVGKTFAVNLGVTFDLTRYKPADYPAQDNTFYYISPSLLYKTPAVNIQAGIRPSWDNKTFKLFPNVLAEISSPDQRFTIQAGWIGYLRKTNLQYLTGFNPWITPPSTLKNTWIQERYVGLKGSVGDHLSYNTKVGWNTYENHPLYLNSLGDGKSFDVVYERKMKGVHIGGEVGYTVGETFSLHSGFTLNQYLGLKDFDKAYGLVPLDIRAAMRVQVMKDLWIKSDFFAWGGSKYRSRVGDTGQLAGNIDLNAGVEFRVTKNINLWAQFNNILNKSYLRWNQYPSYGFNFLAGVIFAFDQKMH